MEFATDVLSVFDKKWALLTAGDKEKFNTMTVSWGGMGTIWGKPVATVYVRKSRYTHEFMEDNDYFTVSFYPEKYRKVLTVLGSKSGRDMDKMQGSGLTAKEASQSMTFEEAEVTLVCRKLFRQELKTENMLPVCFEPGANITPSNLPASVPQDEREVRKTIELQYCE